MKTRVSSPDAMPHPVHKPVGQTKPAVHRHGLLRILPYIAAVLIGASGSALVRPQREGGASRARAQAQDITDVQLVALSDAELAKIDPLVMNLAVARGIPECANLDVARYASIVDGWADAILKVNTKDERSGHVGALYYRDKDLWRAGGMAVELARTYGITYTGERLDLTRPGQSFVHGVIDERTGTCASMPVLYLAVGHRLGWPLHAVVSKDHMWVRWDDGVPVAEGGRRFNLEATTAGMPGHEGQFCSNTDEDYAKELNTAAIAISSGSDMASLTPRETLGVYIQGRAGYWAAKGEWAKAEADALLALSCFPKNRDLRIGLLQALAHTNPQHFTPAEIDRLPALAVGASGGSPGKPSLPLPRLSSDDLDRINRANSIRAATLPPDP